MNLHTLTRLEIIGLCLCMLAIPVLATTLTVDSATLPSVGATTTVVVTGDSFLNGLRGYSINATFTDPSIAEITGITFPAWASMKLNSTVPSTNLSFGATDFTQSIPPGSTDIPLATLTVRGKAAGTTSLTLLVGEMTAWGGGLITPDIVPGTIVVEGIPVTTTVTTTVTSPIPTETTPTETTTVTTTVTSPLPTETTPTETTTSPIPTETTPTETTTTTVTTTTTTAVPPAEPGYVTVFTFPLKAMVTVDDEVIGVSPLINEGLSPGTHTLKISADGYTDYTTTLDVVSGVPQRLPLIILSRSGGSIIPTFPTIVPPTIPTTATQTVTVTQTTTTTQTPTGSGTGAIYVRSYPKNAIIYLNNEASGNTPATIQGLPPGEYEVKVVHYGYQTKVKTVTVVEGKTTSVPLFLLIPDRFTR